MEGGYVFVCSRLLQAALGDSGSTFDSHEPYPMDFGTFQTVPVTAHQGFVASFEGEGPRSNCLGWTRHCSQPLFSERDLLHSFFTSLSGHQFSFLLNRLSQAVRFLLLHDSWTTISYVIQYVWLFLITSLALFWRRGYWESLEAWLLPHELLGTRSPRAGLVPFRPSRSFCRRWTVLHGATTTFHSMFFQAGIGAVHVLFVPSLWSIKQSR